MVRIVGLVVIPERFRTFFHNEVIGDAIVMDSMKPLNDFLLASRIIRLVLACAALNSMMFSCVGWRLHFRSALRLAWIDPLMSCDHQGTDGLWHRPDVQGMDA